MRLLCDFMEDFSWYLFTVGAVFTVIWLFLSFAVGEKKWTNNHEELAKTMKVFNLNQLVMILAIGTKLFYT